MKRTWILCCFAAVLILGASLGWILRESTLRRPNPLPGSAAVSSAAKSNLGKSVPVQGAKADRSSGLVARTGQLSATGTASSVLTDDLMFALGDKTFCAEFRSNGRDRLQLTGTNLNSQPLRVLIPGGQAFENASGIVVTLRDRLVEFRPGEVLKEEVATLGVASGNRVEEEPCAVSAKPQPKLQPLLGYLAEHPEVSTAAAQTAALAIMENLPASAFAKFAVAGSDVPAQWDFAAYKVEVADLVQALVVLRAIGLPDEQLAITVEPQTKIEAMLDPLAHAMAMQYYNIPPEGEWAYWKHELLEGDPGTRHYALHGIARYYPDIALQMLPQWAREPRTNSVFRKAAIEALAETRRTEALPILKAIENDLGPQTDLGKAASAAADYLDTLVGKQATDANQAAGFRIGGT